MNLYVGDKVQIDPLTDIQKEFYPHYWSSFMDDYIGEITTILRIIPGSINQSSAFTEYYLECDNRQFTWSNIHLTKIEPQKVQLF